MANVSAPAAPEACISLASLMRMTLCVVFKKAVGIQTLEAAICGTSNSAGKGKS